jgi:hypothetical protein
MLSAFMSHPFVLLEPARRRERTPQNLEPSLKVVFSDCEQKKAGWHLIYLPLNPLRSDESFAGRCTPILPISAIS